MGWTSLHRQDGQGMKEFFEREWNTKNIIDCAMVNCATVYMAYKTIKSDLANENEIVALVVRVNFHRGYYNFSYKDMDETMMPYYFDCPERILKLLTPTTNENSIEWRKRCWENVNKRKSKPKLKIGDVLKFHKPIRFTNGYEEDTFIVTDPRSMTVKNKYDRYFRLNKYTLNKIEDYVHSPGRIK